MTGKEKYYTPEIEEFCIGFEYEEYISGSGTSYTHKVYDGTNPFIVNIFKDNLQEGWLLVKYLDEQDIIECGFELTHVDKQGGKIYNYFTEELYTPEKIDFVMYELVSLVDGTYFISKGYYITKKYPPSGDVPLFWGTIKNKTEFKKLLKQIGIL